MSFCVIMQDSASCSGNREIKSSAVVKYCAAPPPTSYALLQEKTDLKLPPANWLRESPQLGSAGTTILGSNSKSKPFSRCNTVRNSSATYDNLLSKKKKKKSDTAKIRPKRLPGEKHSVVITFLLCFSQLWDGL